MFAKKYNPLCDTCTKAEEEIFEKVYEYVRENPNQSLPQVAEACEVTTKRLLQYVRDGKIEATNGMNGDVLCSQCQTPIKKGRMCEKCIVETNTAIKLMKKDTSQSVGYHIRY